MLVKKAIEFATIKHTGHKRKFTGEPYIGHPLAVAELVKEVGGTEEMIAAAVLHDTIEDTGATEAEIEKEFGPKVAKLVVELTNVYRSGTGGNRAYRKAKECERLATISPEAMTIKVADLIHNSATIETRAPPEFAKLYLSEKAELLKVLTKAHPAMLEKAKETD